MMCFVWLKGLGTHDCITMQQTAFRYKIFISTFRIDNAKYITIFLKPSHVMLPKLYLPINYICLSMKYQTYGLKLEIGEIICLSLNFPLQLVNPIKYF